MKSILKVITICIATSFLCTTANAQKKKAKPVTKSTATKKTTLVKKPITKNTDTKGELASGIIYNIYPKNIGAPKAKITDMITMNIKVKAGDSILFDSYTLNEGKAVPAQIAKPQYNGDIMESLALMAVGDSAVFIVPQDSVMRNGMKPPFIKATDMITYNVKMVSIKSEAAFKAEQAKLNEAAMANEIKVMDDYVAKNNLQNVQKTASGLRYVITQKGTGENIVAGKTAVMNYTGKFTDGKPFDSNVLPEFNHVQPFEFGLGNGQVIKGWDEGIALLNKGSKATLIIPSILGYGSRESGPIPANSVLIFDVELVDFK